MLNNCYTNAVSKSLRKWETEDYYDVTLNVCDVKFLNKIVIYNLMWRHSER